MGIHSAESRGNRKPGDATPTTVNEPSEVRITRPRIPASRMKTFFPQSVAQDDFVDVAAGDVFLRQKLAAHGELHAQRREQARRNHAGIHRHSDAVVDEIDPLGGPGAQILHGARVVPEILEIGQRDAHAVSRILDGSRGDPHDPFGRGVRIRPQQDSVENAVHRRVEADAGGQDRDHDGRRQRRAQQRPHRESQLPPDGFEEGDHNRFFSALSRRFRSSSSL